MKTRLCDLGDGNEARRYVLQMRRYSEGKLRAVITTGRIDLCKNDLMPWAKAFIEFVEDFKEASG